MNQSNIKTFCMSNAILSKFKFYLNDDAMTVFTTFKNKNQCECISIVKLDKYNRTLLSVNSPSANDALMTHIALIRMSSSNVFIQWSDTLLKQYLPIVEARRLNDEGLYAKSHSFISGFSKKLFKLSGLHIFSDEIGFKIIFNRTNALLSTTVLLLISIINFVVFSKA